MDPTDIASVTIAGGKISVGHRPKLKQLNKFNQQGFTHIWTLLSATEGADEIRKASKENSLEWIWLSLANAKPPARSKLPEIISSFKSCQAALYNGAHVYLHCSAGIHRTGMIAYAFFRYLGYTSAEALTLLKKLRSLTSEGVGDERLDWGDQNFG
jgi:protein-tyrosine phosphatase